MKKLIIYIVLLLFVFLSCNKKGVQLESSDCLYCVDFEDVVINPANVIPFSQLTYDTVWYKKYNITFKSKYFNHTGMGNVGDYAINHVDSTSFNMSNVNYKGNIYFQGNVTTQIDFSDISYKNKKVELDINSAVPTTVNPFYINNFPVNVLPPNVTYRYEQAGLGIHVIAEGAINTIEIQGFEVAIDNVCVDKKEVDFK